MIGFYQYVQMLLPPEVDIGTKWRLTTNKSAPYPSETATQGMGPTCSSLDASFTKFRRFRRTDVVDFENIKSDGSDGGDGSDGQKKRGRPGRVRIPPTIFPALRAGDVWNIPLKQPPKNFPGASRRDS